MRLSTPATISPDVSDRAARLLGIIFGTLGQLAQQLIGGVNTAVVSDRGFTYGASQKSVTLLASGATEQVFAAASNVNGAIVWAAEVATNPGANGAYRTSLHAHTVAPAAYTDGDPIVTASGNQASAAGQVAQQQNIPRSVLIPAGKGLWWLNTAANAESLATRKVLYTLL